MNKFPERLFELGEMLFRPVGPELLADIAMAATRATSPIAEIELTNGLKPFTWFLNRFSDYGVELTAAEYIKPTLVKEIALNTPTMDKYWPTSSESAAKPVGQFRDLLQRELKLIRKYKNRLLLTPAGRLAAKDPLILAQHIANHLVPSGLTKFDEFSRDAVLIALVTVASRGGFAPLHQMASWLRAVGWVIDGDDRSLERAAYEATFHLREFMMLTGKPGEEGLMSRETGLAGVAVARIALGLHQIDEAGHMAIMDRLEKIASIQEAAETLGMPRGALRHREGQGIRLMQSLRPFLEQEGVSFDDEGNPEIEDIEAFQDALDIAQSKYNEALSNPTGKRRTLAVNLLRTAAIAAADGDYGQAFTILEENAVPESPDDSVAENAAVIGVAFARLDEVLPGHNPDYPKTLAARVLFDSEPPADVEPKTWLLAERLVKAGKGARANAYRPNLTMKHGGKVLLEAAVIGLGKILSAWSFTDERTLDELATALIS
jgi:hypothetical protein